MTEVINVKILHLVLKKKWYEMQERGEKPEEYRASTPYWCNRLIGKGYSHVTFHYGYTKRTFTHKIDCITFGYGKPEWGAPSDKKVIIIKHHKEE